MDREMERVNQEVETYLRLFCQGQPNKWSSLIPMAEFAHNSATHSSTQQSPFSLILGYEPHNYLKIGQTFLPSLEDHLTLLEKARDEALAAHEKSRQAMKERITSKFTPCVTVEDPPISFSPFSLVDCTLLEHFSFNDFVAVAFPDIAGDLDIQI